MILTNSNLIPYSLRLNLLRYETNVLIPPIYFQNKSFFTNLTIKTLENVHFLTLFHM